MCVLMLPMACPSVSMILYPTTRACVSLSLSLSLSLFVLSITLTFIPHPSSSFLLSPSTTDKIEILGQNFLPTLLKYMPASSVPQFLGGSCTCADADNECAAAVCRGGMVPKDALEEVRSRVR